MQLHLEVRRLFEYRDGKLIYKEAPPSKKQLLGKEAGCDANGATMHIGVYDTPDEASTAYMQEAKAIHGEFARKE